MDDLADMVIKLAKTVTIPESTVFVVGSLSHLFRVGTVNVRQWLSGAFKGVKVVPFSPPPPWWMQRSGIDPEPPGFLHLASWHPGLSPL